MSGSNSLLEASATGVQIDEKMSHEAYLTHLNLNSSSIKACIKSPWAYNAMKDYPSEPSPAMMRGTLIHMALLEPGRYAAAVAVLPEDIKVNTKAHKEWKAENSNSICISQTEHRTIVAACESVMAIKDAAWMLDNSIKEVSCFWKEGGQGMKARLDMHVDGDIIVDLKTTAGEVDKESFSRLLVAQGAGYAVQAAHYLAFARAIERPYTRFVWIVAQTVPPYEVALFDASSHVLQYGNAWRDIGIQRYREAKASGYWARACEGIVEADLPRWAPYPAT